jgi:hypothetical protein
MSITFGILGKFNSNGKHTITTIGKLDALPAGILVWAELREMLG